MLTDQLFDRNSDRNAALHCLTPVDVKAMKTLEKWIYFYEPLRYFACHLKFKSCHLDQFEKS